MAAEGGFYDSQLFDQLVGVDQAAEKALSGLEGRFGIVLNACVARLREHDFLRFLEPERRTLADMIAEMDRLGPSHRPETVDWGPDVGAEIVRDD